MKMFFCFCGFVLRLKSLKVVFGLGKDVLCFEW